MGTALLALGGCQKDKATTDTPEPEPAEHSNVGPTDAPAESTDTNPAHGEPEHTNVGPQGEPLPDSNTGPKKSPE